MAWAEHLGGGAAKGRVLLVEDDLALAELLKWTLEREGFDTVHCLGGEEALAQAAGGPVPDLVLLDWMLEGMSGLEICARLRAAAATAAVPVIMLTARTGEEDIVRALAAGADDYVTKPFRPRELIARVRAVLRRTRPALAGERLTFGDVEMDLDAHKVRRAGELVALGPTEYRLLRHFLSNPGLAFSRERLLDAVWGPGHQIEPRTIDVHIRRLRLAINAGNRRELIRTIRSVGYALDDDS